jgi:hypothetical protein
MSEFVGKTSLKKLYEQLREIQNEFHSVIEGLDDLKRYLQSSKFKDDTTVQVNDILSRLREITQTVDRNVFTKAAGSKEMKMLRKLSAILKKSYDEFFDDLSLADLASKKPINVNGKDFEATFTVNDFSVYGDDSSLSGKGAVLDMFLLHAKVEREKEKIKRMSFSELKSFLNKGGVEFTEKEMQKAASLKRTISDLMKKCI